MTNPNTPSKRGLFLAGCGGCLTVFFVLGLIGVILGPVLTDGRMSQSEAGWPFSIIGSCCCSFVGLGLLAGGVFLWMRDKKATIAPPPNQQF